jgi:hypothetical protein
MLTRIKTFFFGKKMSNSDLGWELEKFSNGFVIRPPTSPQTYMFRLLPVSANLVMSLIYYCVHSEKFIGSLYALPLSLILGFVYFRKAALSINKKKRIVMCGSCGIRLPFDDVRFELHAGHTRVVQLVSVKTRIPLVIWESRCETGAKHICSLLNSEIE